MRQAESPRTGLRSRDSCARVVGKRLISQPRRSISQAHHPAHRPHPPPQSTMPHDPSPERPTSPIGLQQARQMTGKQARATQRHARRPTSTRNAGQQPHARKAQGEGTAHKPAAPRPRCRRREAAASRPRRMGGSSLAAAPGRGEAGSSLAAAPRPRVKSGATHTQAHSTARLGWPSIKLPPTQHCQPHARPHA
jgi:hypothetical protein